MDAPSRSSSVRASDAFDMLSTAGRDVAGGTDGSLFPRVGAGPHDWHDVLTLAHDHRMVAVVGARLERLPPGTVPPDARDAWRVARAACAAQSLAAARELARVVTVLRAAGVEAIAYKGPALAVVAYGDAGMRPCTDLDLVVPRRAYGAARAALLGAEFASRRRFSRAAEVVVMFGQGHADFARGGSEAPFVELHWRFAAQRLPWSPPVAEVLARADRVRVGGVEVLAPSVDDQVLLLALHGTRHLWEQFEWLVGFGALLQRGTVDAGAVLVRARAVGGVRALLVGVELARRVLGVSTPDLFVQRARDDAPRIDALVRAVTRRWQARGDAMLSRARHDASGGASEDRAAAAVRAAERAFEDACIERRRDRVRRAVASALLPTLREWELVRLPGALTPLYVPLRLVRLAWRGVTGRGSQA